MSYKASTMEGYVSSRAPHLAPRHRSPRTVTVRLTAPRPRRVLFTGRQLAGIALVGAVIGAWLSPGRAYADPVPAVPGGVSVVKLAAGPAGPRIAVTLSNGARDILAPCRYEDGRACYWSAGTMGNGRGSSFIVTRGHVHKVDSRELAAVAR